MGKLLLAGKTSKLSAPSASRLPSGYTELAYIESSGTQRIDTLFTPNDNTKIVMEFQFSAEPTTTSSLFGARNGNTLQLWCFYRYSDKTVAYRFGSSTTYPTIACVSTDRNQITVDGNQMTLNGQTITVTDATFTADRTLHLFAANATIDGQSYPASGLRIFSCQIYDNGVLVRDFVPCRSDADGVGLYDLVERKFYGNAVTGTFIGKEMDGVVTELVLADIAEGSLVKLNENGSPVEFFVACHNYESALNGTGRTLLVRKDCYDKQVWDADGKSIYESSDIDAWLNSTYKAVLDTAVQAAGGTTSFYCMKGGGSLTVITVSRFAFLLGMSEMGQPTSSGFYNADGSALPIADLLSIAYMNGVAVDHWLRSYFSDDDRFAWAFNASGSSYFPNVTTQLGIRPCFTLPATAKFDPDTLQFLEVS